jgi:hypothetical protein
MNLNDYLYNQYINENVRLKKKDSLNIKLVRNDLIICTCYFKHRMNSFRKII